MWWLCACLLYGVVGLCGECVKREADSDIMSFQLFSPILFILLGIRNHFGYTFALKSFLRLLMYVFVVL